MKQDINYIAVHAYGQAKIIRDQEQILVAPEQMIKYYDVDYLDQWQSLSLKFKQGMMRGITAFTMEVTELQGQKN